VLNRQRAHGGYEQCTERRVSGNGVSQLSDERSGGAPATVVQGQHQRGGTQLKSERAQTAWSKNSAAHSSLQGVRHRGKGADRVHFEIPREIQQIIRHTSPPPERRHGDPHAFLKRTDDPKAKIFGNRRQRIQQGWKRPSTTPGVWAPPTHAPLENKCAVRDAAQLPRRATLFFRMWALGHFDFCRVRFAASREGLRWTTPIRQLDAKRLLPLFLDGLREPTEPARFIAIQGTEDLTYAATRAQLLAAAPECAESIKAALDTREPVTVTVALLALGRIIRREAHVVHSMLPFLAQFAAPIALFNGSRLEVYPSYDRHKVVRMQEAIDGVLHAFADHGGPGAAAIMGRHLPGWRQVTGTEAPAAFNKRSGGCITAVTMPYTIV